MKNPLVQVVQQTLEMSDLQQFLNVEPLLSTLQSIQSPGTVSDTIFKSVVKVFAVTCQPNYSRPWQMKSQSHSSSTGFAMAGKRIICNAHGVSYARSIRLRKHGDSKKYDAKIFSGYSSNISKNLDPELPIFNKVLTF